jgi:hypothetical protein
MFVRWKRRKRTYGRGGRGEEGAERAGDSIDVVLVESLRVGGRVRQRFVCHLAHVHEKQMAWIGRRADFWKQVIPRLDALRLDLSERAKIEAQLDRVMPRLSPDGQAASDKATTEHRAWNQPGISFIQSRRRGKYHTRNRSA